MNILKQIRKSAQQAIQPGQGIFQKIRRNRRRKEALDEAFSLDRSGKYAEAAGVYARLAEEEAQANPLIYQLYNHDAFREWLKANDLEKTMQAARDALKILGDTGWLGRSSEAVDDLSQMVGELYVAGRSSEAEALSQEINSQLAAHGVAPRDLSAETQVETGASAAGSKLPTICPQCGGSLPRSHGAYEITCPYCGSVIRVEG
jgi:predicted RNA-binding Zn-ribbon protein involved in translation (DUF1610 family)